jgi:hypothetical protein
MQLTTTALLRQFSTEFRPFMRCASADTVADPVLMLMLQPKPATTCRNIPHSLGSLTRHSKRNSTNDGVDALAQQKQPKSSCGGTAEWRWRLVEI